MKWVREEKLTETHEYISCGLYVYKKLKSNYSILRYYKNLEQLIIDQEFLSKINSEDRKIVLQNLPQTMHSIKC